MDATILHDIPPGLVFWLQLLLPFLPFASRRPMVLVILILAVMAMQALIVFWAFTIVSAIDESSDGPWVIVFGGIVAFSLALSVSIAIGRLAGMLVASRMADEPQRRRARAIADLVGVAAVPAAVAISTQL